jgi:hypothetical protein
MRRALPVLVALAACRHPGETDAGVPVATRVLFGDVHVHTGKASGDACASDAGPEWNRDPSCGAFADLADSAVSNGMDFVVLSDHVNGEQDAAADNGPAISDEEGGDAAWREVCSWAYDASTPDFVALCGAEAFFTADGAVYGHKTLIFFDDAERLAPLTRDELSPTGINSDAEGTASTTLSACDDVATWADGLRDRYGAFLLVPHHPGVSAPMRTSWGCHAEEHERAVEVWSKHGSSRIKLAGAEPPGDDHEPALSSTGGDNAANTGTYAYMSATYGEDAGYHMAVLGGGDYHRTRAGYVCHETDEVSGEHEYGGALTGVVVDEEASLARDVLHDAILARHTFATTGPRVPIALSVSDEDGWVGTMGDRLDLDRDADLTFVLTVPAPFDDEVKHAWVVKQGPCTTGASATCSEDRIGMTEDARGVWTATASLLGDGDDADDDGAYVLVELEGPDSHPDGCFDGGTDDRERIMTSEIHTF